MLAIDWDSFACYGNSLAETIEIFKDEIFEKIRFLKLAADNQDYAEVSFIANHIAGTCAGVSARAESDLAKRVEKYADARSYEVHQEIILLTDNLNRLICEIDLALDRRHL